MPIEVAALQIPASWTIGLNLARILADVRDAGEMDVLVLPEGAVSGYSPRAVGSWISWTQGRHTQTLGGH